MRRACSYDLRTNTAQHAMSVRARGATGSNNVALFSCAPGAHDFHASWTCAHQTPASYLAGAHESRLLCARTPQGGRTPEALNCWMVHSSTAGAPGQKNVGLLLVPAGCIQWPSGCASDDISSCTRHMKTTIMHNSLHIKGAAPHMLDGVKGVLMQETARPVLAITARFRLTRKRWRRRLRLGRWQR